jgi:hypothetical protein
MTIIKVKGHEIKLPTIRDSFQRRSQQYKNDIIKTLKKLDLTEDDCEIELIRMASRRVPAKVLFYFDGHRMFYSYQNPQLNFTQNMYIAAKVIEIEVDLFVNKQKSNDDFVRTFSEDDNIEKQRAQARELLGVEAGSLDLNDINKKYKVLAKKYHPDMPGGSLQKFKEINNAHKTLKRELE